MEFSGELREDVLAGEITLSIRLWKRPQVKEGGRYRGGPGLIEIDARLYLSHRTIATHLYRVFPKLGVTARSRLTAALSADRPPSSRACGVGRHGRRARLTPRACRGRLSPRSA